MSDPVWLCLNEVNSIHLAALNAHGGASGTRDEGLLQAAIAHPQQIFAYEEPTPDLCTLAAAYAAGIIQNHPFVDGNKRTGFLSTYTFLGLNGLELTASEVEAASMVIALASGEMEEKVFAQWLRERT